MSILLKKPVLLAVGGFMVFGAFNGITEAITGTYITGFSASGAAVEQAQKPPAGPWKAPTAGKMTSNYNQSGSMWSSGHHTGVDFPVPVGTAVNAVDKGTVVTVGAGGAYGNQIVIKHGAKLYSQYAHLAKVLISRGDHVRAGQKIGLSGSTGNVTGPHLHFEARTGPSYGSDINPVPLLKGTS
jgi:murein DD-endopeptidase MepM/ murein hydrolase activator NlpD